MLRFRIREKITGLLVFYFVLALIAISSTLFVSWKLEGGAAAINDAGRERMRSYRIAFLLSEQVHHPSSELRQDIEREITLFENTLVELEFGNPQRPLFLPKEPEVDAKVSELKNTWMGIKPKIQKILYAKPSTIDDRSLSDYRPALESFVSGINDLVAMVEKSNANAAAMLRSIQIALVIVALIGTIVLDYIFSLLLVRPVQRLNQGLKSMGEADFGVRLPISSSDELGELAQGLNQMAEELQDIYHTLEQRVEEKTLSLEIKNRELSTLYEIAAALNSSATTEVLCENVLDRTLALIGAKGGVIRLTTPKGEQLQIIAAKGVSRAFLADEAYLVKGACVCGQMASLGCSVNTDLTSPGKPLLLTACNREGFNSLTTIPIRSNQKTLGMMNLFFESVQILPATEVRLLESIGLQLGIAIENQNLVAREREMAVSEERNLLAQELHDSIAQSLAFLNIQVQMLQDDLSKEKVSEAMGVLEQIREGVQESYDDVRELLVHFRTRFEQANIEDAIINALERFEAQSTIKASFKHQGPDQDIPPEHIMQVLHILQESLSNIRKHSRASGVEVKLTLAEQNVLTVKDNGRGFDPSIDAGDSHIGIRIMRERAHRFGGQLQIHSSPGQGAEISLIWTPTPISTEQGIAT